jgi:predicted permease
VVIAELFAITAPVLIAVGLGFIWARRGGHFDPDLVTALITTIGAPALIFHTVANLSVSLAEFARVLAATLALLLATAGLGSGILLALRLPLRAFLPVLVFPNTGNMGLPLSLLAFGQNGLTLAVGIFTVCLVAQFTGGVALSSGRLSLRYLARMPVLWALVPATACVVLRTPPPGWINATADLVGGMTIPLMLLTLGVSLAGLRVAGIARSSGLAMLRLGLGFGLGVAIAELFALDPLARGVLILQSSMPTAVFNYLFAQRYGTAPEEVAGAVTISTLLSFVSLPLLLLAIL